MHKKNIPVIKISLKTSYAFKFYYESKTTNFLYGIIIFMTISTSYKTLCYVCNLGYFVIL